MTAHDGDRPGSWPPAADSEDYSATVLASHWVQGPGPEPAAVPDTVVVWPETPLGPPGDGTVLRFGPGVTAALARTAQPAPPQVPAARRRGPGRLRRHALPVIVLVGAVLFLGWRQDAGAPPAVREVSVTTAHERLGCDATAVVVAVVRTDGRPGSLAYRWTRSDGTASAVGHTAVARGQRQVRLRLLWTFEGPGRHAAVARLRVLAPERRSAEVRFTYACP